jgi:ferric-dicitrate binding protein FerR (iron transport regulator)
MRYLILLFFTWPVFAEDIHVSMAKGTVEVDSGSGFHRAAPNQALKPENSVRTLAASTAIITYPNGTALKLNASSSITIHEQKGIDLHLGAVFAHVNKESHPHFFVKTRAAIAGVRGTDFFTSVGNADGWLCVKDGEVEVKGADAAPVIVGAGFGIVIEQGKKIAPPKEYAWTKKLNWNMDPGAGDITDKTSPDSVYNNPLKHNYD